MLNNSFLFSNETYVFVSPNTEVYGLDILCYTFDRDIEIKNNISYKVENYKNTSILKKKNASLKLRKIFHTIKPNLLADNFKKTHVFNPCLSFCNFTNNRYSFFHQKFKTILNSSYVMNDEEINDVSLPSYEIAYEKNIFLNTNSVRPPPILGLA